MLPAQPNQSVVDSLACLEAVVASPQPVGVRELARQLGLDRMRVNRLLMTLAHFGVLHRTDRGRYRPGSGIHVLAALAMEGSSLQRAAVGRLRGWWQEGYAVTLGVLWREYICYIVRARPAASFEEGLGGRRGPALESSAGLVLLAAQPASRRRRLTVPPPGNVVLPVGGVDELIRQARANRYARLDFADGTVSLGVPIGRPALAGLAVSRRGLGTQDIQAIVRRLRDTASSIAADLRQ